MVGMSTMQESQKGEKPQAVLYFVVRQKLSKWQIETKKQTECQLA